MLEAFGLDLGPYIDPTITPYCRFDAFSASYTAVLMFIVLVAISMKKDLSIFVKMGSVGAVCVTMMIVFIIGYSVYSMTVTDYKIYDDPSAAPPRSPVNDFHGLFMFNSTFANLAGLLNTGYYLH